MTERLSGLWGFLLALLLAGLILAGYLLAAGRADVAGYPLDDAWIHQTYARNLAESGRWAYAAGESSAGSTAPLWTLLLAAGYLLPLPARAWTLGLGALSLALVGWLTTRLAVQLRPRPRWLAPTIGLLTIAEWHLVWAAASGMETCLFIALTLALFDGAGRVFEGGDHPSRRWLVLGSLAGLLVLTRPEGLLPVGLVALWGGWLLLQRVWGWRELRRAALAAFPFLILLALYLLLNYRLGGRAWPNTLYAKQTEYAALLARPLLQRLAQVALPPLVGAQILLLPGLLVLAQRITGRRQPHRFAHQVPLAYLFLHLLLYALRLPVTYQHGRYLIPVIPYFLLLGALGSARWLSLRDAQFWRRVLSRSGLAAVVVLQLCFLIVGGRTYARDVQVIESEMVAVARWLAEHSAPDEPVAAHDIGAIGYFANRPIVDLAGLISPGVVPLMDDEQALADYVLASQARYLVTAPGWPYPLLTNLPGVEQLFDAASPWARQQGLNSSAVYRLPAD